MLRSKWLPWFVALLCLAPVGFLIVRALNGDLGPNPITAITRDLGVWALRLIIGGLAISPLVHLTKQTALIRLRRPIGLVAFAYLLLHLSSYIGLDQFFDWSAIWKDIVKRPYITIGMAAFVLLTPLAITSANAMIRKLGPKTWRRLHQPIYLIAVLGVLHYLLLVKADHKPPLVYGAILSLLLLYRLVRFAKQRVKTSGAMSAAAR
jgi:sulfoxide reductase heme-binding subunit YedZ